MKHKTKKPIKPRAGKGTFKRLLKYIWAKNKVNYLIVIFCIILSTVAQVLSQAFLGSILVNKYLAPYESGAVETFDWNGFSVAMSVIGLIYVIGLTANYTFSRILVSITHKTIKNLRDDLYHHMQKLPLQFFDSRQDGEIVSLYTNDIVVLRDVISQSIPQIINSIFTISLSLVIMFILSWFLTIVMLLLVTIMFFISQLIARKSGRYFRNRQAALGAVNGYINELIEGIKVVKVFNYEKHALNKFSDLNNKLYHSDFKSKVITNILMPIMMNMGTINFVVIAFIGGISLANTSSDSSSILSLNIGVLVSFLLYARSFSNPISTVAQQFNAINMGVAGAERVFNVLDQKTETDNGDISLVRASELSDQEKNQISSLDSEYLWKVTDKNEVKFLNALGHIKFENVCFGYDSNKLIIDNFNLEVNPGEKVALVGSTGAGKTTIANLINRFYDLTSGTIYFDGIDTRKIKKDDLRRAFGLVLQDTSLFSKTVSENIGYGLLKPTQEQIEQAAVVSNANEFIEIMSDGYQTYLENAGENLSQGQKQLLSIARTSILNPLVLILDEATSTIDTQTEKQVQQALDKLLHGKTSFIIAHRLSTIKNSDKIIVLEHGKIIEQGSHKELLKNKKYYYQLYTGATELD
ncbi:ABC transporter ATP-binding protein [Mycoplasma buteonis]|uniref:ABC transporter ATP-binding protein n=1 Tax=Mycoplasma buteonis TaxID=171280 RepID=UPI00068C579A|nr:ABC transporter ATP-binding protein [Mycoplasma buteonis]